VRGIARKKEHHKQKKVSSHPKISLISDFRCCIIRYNTIESRSVFVGLSFKTGEEQHGRSSLLKRQTTVEVG
jgi:hypothetical protein